MRSPGREVINESFPVVLMPSGNSPTPREKNKGYSSCPCLLAEMVGNALSHLMAGQVPQKMFVSSSKPPSLPHSQDLEQIFVRMGVLAPS